MTFTQLLAMVQGGQPRLNVCVDSRQVKSGDIFVAVRGTHVDGHDYITQAVQNGATYVVCEQPSDTGSATCILVEHSSQALGILAQSRYGNPAMKLTNLAVTGTNGKTTVAFLVRSILQTAGKRCGMVGTIQYDLGDGRCQPARLTTPDAIELARLGQQMVEAGTEYVMMEASSHALSQDRLAGIPFTAAAFTNLTGDHLDYHLTSEAYLEAKSHLFTHLPVHGSAILNRQSPAARFIANHTRARVFWYDINEPANVYASLHSMDIHETQYDLIIGAQRTRIRTPLIGLHNISNQLAAAGLCMAAGLDLETIGQGIGALGCVPGRLESIRCGQDFAVFVDYAHTDDALRNVLNTLAPLALRRLIVVFGCGGDRDRTKRPRMAAVAEEQAHRIIVTNDNPRSESPQHIFEDISGGFNNANAEHITFEPDRRKAIALALHDARANDIVLIAGKGHEDVQVIGDQRVHFSDVEVAHRLLEHL